MTMQTVKTKLVVTRFPWVMMSRQLRPAQMTDIPALRKLIDQSVRHLGRRDYTPEQIESALQYIFGIDSQLIADGTYYVVEIGGQLAGAGGWSQHKVLYSSDQTKPPKEDNRLDPAREPAKIRAFYVHPDWARQGIGRQMMAACEAAAREAGFTRLELMATLTGKPLYAACGFVEAEPHQIEMPDGGWLPVVKMTKSLV